MSKLDSMVVVRLDDATVERMDKRVRREKTTRSEWIRGLITNALTTVRKSK